MNKFMQVTLISLIFCLSSTNGYSESDIESLSPELRALLKQEMAAIEQGMQNIIPVYISGNLPEIAEIAGQIKRSYILKQKLSESQKRELRTKLPKEFIAKDQQFHKYAGMLEHVSHEKHTELVGFYYSKLLESCVSCHTEYAEHRFPGLTGGAADDEHHH